MSPFEYCRFLEQSLAGARMEENRQGKEVVRSRVSVRCSNDENFFRKIFKF